ncbi:50S ribosomal protein L15 [Rhodopirellula sp. JC740]|uniref:Large ribosomal subunit protein uL15 n=1 Tax=Rhodopirellula halodulae TaxID=2894198 RepID=A0ABS8NKZ4_9BACT|nr:MULTISPECIES: 50S ribosomal protein L15 [unclassified Rhodopirellula]MCC9644205.1 50S ribosomal protein L15 [Rhodopirellula sp. JC740]MCC9657366.1 50S ribosomal protein L15 [Rhodopirellula sp. JC737]
MQLNDVHRGITKNRPRKRIGRGPGSGTGKTSGRGHKGHKSRSGYSRKPNFQGGAMPMFRRVPKRGFNNRWALTIFAVNVGKLNEAFNDGETVTLEALAAKNLAKGNFDELKVLGDGELTKKLTVQAHRFSKSAEEKISSAGGTAEKLAPKRTPDERVAALKSEK